ncbi:hypothetical protein Agub_g14507 [Astrephomene gubernaculifera]|uniref:Sulfotransferase n=1 Tax=Astrephomene gubernaculifera TaxID=47775 RepID=A0AAD3HTG4_9CHLO|nr:hypothetical protein Agub_g14507 [Astrephomene gubernaculifera]
MTINNSLLSQILLLELFLFASIPDLAVSSALEVAPRELFKQAGLLGPTFGSQKCVFVLATGRSGSTALMDALNQIPNYLIRGEHWSAFWNLYSAYLRLKEVKFGPGQELFEWPKHANDGASEIKQAYERHAPITRLPLFSEIMDDRIMLATRMYYSVLYGHYGEGTVSGFKEIRYVCGTYFGHRATCTENFHAFTRFLRGLCGEVKMIFNTRYTPSLEQNAKLFYMDNTTVGRTANTFQDELVQTHALFDEYTKNNPDHAFRVYLRDMYDPKRNWTLAQNLLQFLGEKQNIPIRFNRMPGWQPGR